MDPHLAVFLLFNLFMIFTTGLLFCTTQKALTPVKDLHLFWNANVIVLARNLIDDLT